MTSGGVGGEEYPGGEYHPGEISHPGEHVGARLAASMMKLWLAQAVGTPGGTRAPGASLAAAPHAAVASALRNVVAYSATAKRAALEARLPATLLKVMAKARKIIAYDRAFDEPTQTTFRAQAPPAPLAMEAESVLLECVSLLKHALYCPPDAAAAHERACKESGGGSYLEPESSASLGRAAAALREEAHARGALGAMHALWRHAANEPTDDLIHELMGACANALAENPAGKRAATEAFDAGEGAKPASLAERMLTLAFRNTTPPATQRLALAPLAALASEPSSRRWLLRSSFLTEVISGLRSAFKRRDAQRLVALLRAAADVAGGGGEEGRREVLRVGGGDLVRLLLEILASAGVGGDATRRDDSDSEDDVDVILAGTANAVFHPRLPVAALETLLLLRNLCFHPEAKAHVTAEPRAVDALVAAAGAADPGARAAAADALLALVHNGQRVAAQLRHGTRPARLRRAAGRAYRETQRASEEGSGPSRAEATAHASKCLAALVAVLGISGGGADFKNGNQAKEGASPDSTLLDIDEAEFGKAGEMCADGLALGPEWVYR